MNPRQGPLGRMHHIREASWGTDPTTPTANLMPFITDGFQLRQPRARGVFYDGVLSPKGSYMEPITVDGEITMSLDYHYVGNDLADVIGLTGYTRTGSLHRWASISAPLPHQIRKEFTQTTAIIHRYAACIATMMRFAQATRGQQQYSVGRLGKGLESVAEIAGTTLSDTTIKRVNSYFNGSLVHDGVVLGNTSAFDLTIDNHVTPKEGVFQLGELAAYSLDVPEVRGTLGKIFSTEDGDAFYNLARLETPSSLECLYANAPLAAGASMWLRFTMPRILFDRSAPAVGGATIPDQNQAFYAETADSTVYSPARAIGTVVGPWTFSTANVVSVKFEGGATIDVVIAAGSKSAATVAALLNADVTFAAAGTAYDLAGRLEIRSDNALTGSSVQWQTATTNSAHTLLGFTGTTYTAIAPTALFVELYNDVSSDYT